MPQFKHIWIEKANKKITIWNSCYYSQILSTILVHKPEGSVWYKLISMFSLHLQNNYIYKYMLLLYNKFLVKAKRLLSLFRCRKSRQIYFLKTKPMGDQSKKRLYTSTTCAFYRAMVSCERSMKAFHWRKMPLYLFREDPAYLFRGEKPPSPHAGRVAKLQTGFGIMMFHKP